MSPSLEIDNPSTKGGDRISVAEYEEVISYFLDRISYKNPNIQHKLPAEPDVLDHFKLIGLDRDYMPKAIRIAQTGSAMADFTYPFHPHPVRVAIGVYTTYLILVDDFGDEFMDDILNFRRRLFQGQEQPNILLRSFLKFLPCFDSYYGDYACDMICKNSIEMISSCVVENKCDKHGRKLVPAGATLFPEFFRLKTGISEAFAHFLFLKTDFPEDEYLGFYLSAIPDLSYTFNINDLLSFYKESIRSTERFNYVYNFANASGVSPYDALHEMSNLAVKNFVSAREILAANPQMRTLAEEFIQGYIAFHWIDDDRYRLSELSISPK